MKRSTLLFIAAVVAFIVGVFFFQQKVTHRYDWTPTYSPTDRNPFGTALFDTLMAETMPNGYRVENTSLEEYVKLHAKSTHEQVLTVENYFTIAESEIDSILNFVARGNTLIFAEDYPSTFKDTLHYDLLFHSGYFDLKNAQRLMGSKHFPIHDTLTYCGKAVYAQNAFPVFDNLIPYGIVPSNHSLQPYSSETVICFYDEETGMTPVAQKFYVGEGTIYIVTIPYLFTNYAAMDPDMRNLSLRLMNELAEHPVVHVHQKDSDEELADDGLPLLSYIKKQPPLLFAWRLALIGAVLVLLVNSRRRRRAIPEKREEPNTTISFLRQLSQLYRKRSDHSPLIHKHYRTFAAHLLREHRIDVQDKNHATRLHVTQTLATLTSRSTFDVGCDLDELDHLNETIPPVTPQMYKHAVELMKRLTPKA